MSPWRLERIGCLSSLTRSPVSVQPRIAKHPAPKPPPLRFGDAPVNPPGLRPRPRKFARTLRGPGHLRRTAHRPGPVPPGAAGHIVPMSFGRAGVRSGQVCPTGRPSRPGGLVLAASRTRSQGSPGSIPGGGERDAGSSTDPVGGSEVGGDQPAGMRENERADAQVVGQHPTSSGRCAMLRDPTGMLRGFPRGCARFEAARHRQPIQARIERRLG